MTGLGRILQEARAVRGIALEEAENATRISRRYLEALENEDFSVFPAPVYARGFLRSYSQYLGLNPVDVLALYPAPAANEPGNRGRTTTSQPSGRDRRQPATSAPPSRTPAHPAAPPTQTRIPQPSRAPAIMTAGVIVFLIVLGVVYIASSLGGGDTGLGPDATATVTRVVRTTTSTTDETETPEPALTPGGTVPDLVTRSVGDATDDLDALRIPYVVITLENDVQQAGEVFDQSPPAGTEVDADVAVTLLVNATAEPDEEPSDEEATEEP